MPTIQTYDAQGRLAPSPTAPTVTPNVGVTSELAGQLGDAARTMAPRVDAYLDMKAQDTARIAAAEDLEKLVRDQVELKKYFDSLPLEERQKLYAADVRTEGSWQNRSQGIYEESVNNRKSSMNGREWAHYEALRRPHAAQHLNWTLTTEGNELTGLATQALARHQQSTANYIFNVGDAEALSDAIEADEGMITKEPRLPGANKDEAVRLMRDNYTYSYFDGLLFTGDFQRVLTELDSNTHRANLTEANYRSLHVKAKNMESAAQGNSGAFNRSLSSQYIRLTEQGNRASPEQTNIMKSLVKAGAFDRDPKHRSDVVAALVSQELIGRFNDLELKLSDLESEKISKELQHTFDFTLSSEVYSAAYSSALNNFVKSMNTSAADTTEERFDENVTRTLPITVGQGQDPQAQVAILITRYNNMQAVEKAIGNTKDNQIDYEFSNLFKRHEVSQIKSIWDTRDPEGLEELAGMYGGLNIADTTGEAGRQLISVMDNIDPEFGMAVRFSTVNTNNMQKFTAGDLRASTLPGLLHAVQAYALEARAAKTDGNALNQPYMASPIVPRQASYDYMTKAILGDLSGQEFNELQNRIQSGETPEQVIRNMFTKEEIMDLEDTVTAPQVSASSESTVYTWWDRDLGEYVSPNKAEKYFEGVVDITNFSLGQALGGIGYKKNSKGELIPMTLGPTTGPKSWFSDDSEVHFANWGDGLYVLLNDDHQALYNKDGDVLTIDMRKAQNAHEARVQRTPFGGLRDLVGWPLEYTAEESLQILRSSIKYMEVATSENPWSRLFDPKDEPEAEK